MDMFFVLLGVHFILMYIFVKIDQILGSLHSLCISCVSLCLLFKAKKLCPERVIELPNITKVEIKLKVFFCKICLTLLRSVKLIERTFLFVSWNALVEEEK